MKIPFLSLWKKKGTTRKENLRRVAVVLIAMPKERRNLMLGKIKERDPETAEIVKALMITWDDIPKVEDKCFQDWFEN